jgi:putative ABC transport system substrate-binding protein
MIRRREFIAGLGGVAAWPLAARAQQRAMPVIGYITFRTADSDASMLVSFRRGLSDVGYVEGRNVAVEYRFADGRYDRVSGQLADLTQRKVGVIVLTGGSFSSRNWCSKSTPRRSRSSSALATIRFAWAS